MSSPLPEDFTATHALPWYKRWWALLGVFPTGLLAVGGLLTFVFLFVTLPLPDELAAQPSAVLDARGRQVGTLNPSVAQQDVELSGLPEHVPQAVMAAEDRGFYDHIGISPVGVVRALFTNVRAGEITAGGSTITQQYIKNAALTDERTLTRKIKEAVLAIKAERSFSKDEILELYLNTVYLGRGATGLEAAARTYFDVRATELSVNQAATLAGIIRAPEALDPADNADGADRRRHNVLDGMLEQGWIDQSTHDELSAAGLPEVQPDGGVAPGPNAYYLDAVQKELAAKTNITNPYTGLRIHTALETRLQALGQRTIREAVGGESFTGALVSVDVSSGGVRALVGGPNYTEQPFNAAYDGRRPVGSTFKVPTLAAFTEAGHHPSSQFPGPVELTVTSEEARAGGCPNDGEYTPENYGGASYGSTSVRRATASSINTIFVQMELEVGCPDVIDAARALGLPDREGDDGMQPVPSLTLGPFGFSPLEMASAYATLPAEGTARPAHLITRIEGPDGQVLHEPEPARENALAANDSRIVTDLLEGVVDSGTGTAAQIGRPAAGKTGTTLEGRDGWFVGYVPQLATAVWMGPGQGDGAAPELTGGGVPAETWAAFMEPAVEPMEVVDFGPPDLTDMQQLGGDADPAPAPTPDATPAETSQPEPTESPTPPSSPAPAPSPRPTDPAPRPTDPAPAPTSTPSQPPATPDPSPAPEPSPTATGG